MKIRVLLFTFVLINVIGWSLFFFTSHDASKQNSIPLTEVKKNKIARDLPVSAAKQKTSLVTENERWMQDKVTAIKAQATNLNINVLKLSLNAYQKAQQRGLITSPLLTIIDYSQPSSLRRLWVVDITKKKVLFNTLVAHGKNSGSTKASSFSNRPSSLKSSLGVFVTDEIYSGKHGHSLRVQGLEPGINDNAYDRSIVFHGAHYVSNSIAKMNGMIGRSWGCMAVSEDMIKPLINTIKNKTLVFIYYPDKNWLNTSSYL